MNGIQIFRNQEFGAIRTMTSEQGEPMFCAKDVAGALGYGNSREALRKHVETEDVTKCDTPTTGGVQSMVYINESGLYALILSSKLDSAKRFKHWVTGEVLPSIRKQGGYMVVRPHESDEVIMARALQIMCLAFDPGNVYGQTRVGTGSVSERVCIRFNWNASTTIHKVSQSVSQSIKLKYYETRNQKQQPPKHPSLCRPMAGCFGRTKR